MPTDSDKAHGCGGNSMDRLGEKHNMKTVKKGHPKKCQTSQRVMTYGDGAVSPSVLVGVEGGATALPDGVSSSATRGAL